MEIKVGDAVFVKHLKCYESHHRWEVFKGTVRLVEGRFCFIACAINNQETRIARQIGDVFLNYQDALDYCCEANNSSVNDNKATIKRLIEDINYTLSYDGEVND